MNRVLVLLTAALVTSDWVEISQHYQRQQPLRTLHHNDVEYNRSYRNQSLNIQWNRAAVNKVSNVGNVRKVPYASVKTPSIKPYNFQQFDSFKFLKTTPQTDLIPEINRNSTKQNPEESHDIEAINFNNAIATLEDNYNMVSEKVTSTKNLVNITKNIQTLSDKTTENAKSPNQVYVNTINESADANVNIEYITESIENILNSKANKNHINKEEQEENKTNMTTAQKELNYVENVKSSGTKGDDDNNEQIRNNPEPSKNKFENLWNVIRTITESVLQNTKSTFQGKVIYLDTLKNTILSNIEYLIEHTWPDDQSSSSRERRSAEARGHVEIPSSESALMTISFLTFAVFLIKLVLVNNYLNL
ncbi:unnamed protein product [Leptidea sinapis]|uniref:Uncharacterized protein n=1 Tax=Leptidea sinapis TaxID=189913 RepID=A0A5E4PS99_9NEOP|nr:unnamed protein product [Leptidea sinapis]